MPSGGKRAILARLELPRLAKFSSSLLQVAPRFNPVRIDHLAPELALITTAIKDYGPQELKIGGELGRGGFAVVLRGELVADGTPVACKQLLVDEFAIELGEATMDDAFTEFRREAWLMANLHPNLDCPAASCGQLPVPIAQ